jgi:hypothetical protein
MIKRQSNCVELCLGNKDRHGFKMVMVIFHSVDICKQLKGSNPFLNVHLKITYPNLTACSSGPEERICIFLHLHILDTVCGIVKLMLENNTFDLLKERKKHAFFCTIIFERERLESIIPAQAQFRFWQLDGSSVYAKF